jgi:hypothetical protein
MYSMHPEMSRTLIDQRHLQMRQAAESRRGPVRRFPRWHLSWSKMSLPAAGSVAKPRFGGRGSSLVIIITAHRPA